MGKKLGLLAVLFLLPFTAVADNPIAFRTGPGVQMTCSASAPNHIATRGMVWCKSTDSNKLHYMDTTGADSAIGGGHNESNFSAITAGTGNTHEYLDVTMGSSFAAATGASGYAVDVQVSLTTNTDPGIVWWIVNKTSSSFRINFSGSFNGEVRWRAY